MTDFTSRPRRFRRTIAAVLLGTTVLTGTALVAEPPSVFAQTAQFTQGPITAPANTNITTGLPGSFAPLVDKVSPAVVTIIAQGAAPREDTAQRGHPAFPPGSPFEEFFKRFGQPFGPGQGPMQRGPQGNEDDDSGPGEGGTALGSGFVIDAEGHVVTNNHVIDGAREVTVTLNDGTKLPATVVGRDAKTDLALLKVGGGARLPHLAFGDSDGTKVGDWVIAVGNPFGLGGTVTAGIVSARGRNIDAGPYDDFIQTDAAINRGNSGGPMFNAAGEVIGINTAIYSPSGGSVGIGFAIPSNLARTVVAQLKEHGKVERGWLGVSIQQVTPEIADSLGLQRPAGALVADVQPDSPAAKAGIRQGDVVMSFDGKPVSGNRDLSRHVAETKAGASVPVVVVRGGQERTIQVAIARMPGDRTVADAGTPGSPGKGTETVRGLTLAPAVNGVEITRVARDAGPVPVRPGDVIRMVNGAAVDSPAAVAHAIADAQNAGRKSVLLLVARQGVESFVALPVKAA